MWLLWFGLVVQTVLVSLLIEQGPSFPAQGCILPSPKAKRVVVIHIDGPEEWPPAFGVLAGTTVAKADVEGPLAVLGGVGDDFLASNFYNFFRIKKHVSTFFDDAELSIFAGPKEVADMFALSNGSLPFTRYFAPEDPSIWQLCQKVSSLIEPDDVVKNKVIAYIHLPASCIDQFNVLRNVDEMVKEIEKKFANDAETAWIVTTNSGAIFLWGSGIKKPSQVDDSDTKALDIITPGKKEIKYYLINDAALHDLNNETFNVSRNEVEKYQLDSNANSTLIEKNMKKNLTDKEAAARKIDTTIDVGNTLKTNAWEFMDYPLALNMTDLAALISALTGLKPPALSKGQVPVSLLDMTPTHMAQAVVCNALHLSSRARNASLSVPDIWMGDTVMIMNKIKANLSLEFNSWEEAMEAVKTGEQLATSSLIIMHRASYFFCFIILLMYMLITFSWLCVLICELLPIETAPTPFVWKRFSSHPKVATILESVRRFSSQKGNKPVVDEPGDGMTEIPLRYSEPPPLERNNSWRHYAGLGADAFLAVGVALSTASFIIWAWPWRYFYFMSLTVLSVWTAIRGLAATKIVGHIQDTVLSVIAAVALSAAFNGSPGLALDGGISQIFDGAPGAAGLALLGLLVIGPQSPKEIRLGALISAVVLTVSVPWAPPSSENPWFLYPTAVIIMALTLTSLWTSSRNKTELWLVISLAAIQGTAFVLTATSDAIGGIGPFGGCLALASFCIPIIEAFATERQGRSARAAAALAIPVLFLSTWTEPLIYAAAVTFTILWVIAELRTSTADHTRRGLVVSLASGTGFAALGGQVVVSRIAATKSFAPVLSFARQWCASTAIACPLLKLHHNFLPAIFLAPAIAATIVPLPIPPFFLCAETRMALAVFQIVTIFGLIIAKYLYRMDTAKM